MQWQPRLAAGRAATRSRGPGLSIRAQATPPPPLNVLCPALPQGDLPPGLSARRLVVAADLAEALSEKFGVPLRTLCKLRGAALEGATYRHPLFDRESPVVVGGDYITTESGTGLVHTAPGHGQEDYLVGGWAGGAALRGCTCIKGREVSVSVSVRVRVRVKPLKGGLPGAWVGLRAVLGHFGGLARG